MSEPAAQQRQMIDLDEFERRLSRSSAPARSGEDPLVELARLVGDDEDRFGNLFQARPSRGRAPELRAPQPPVHHIPDWLVEESHIHSQQPAQPSARSPQPARSQPASQSRQPYAGPPQPFALPPIDFATIEAGLRGSLPPEYRNFAETDDYADPQAEEWFDTPPAAKLPPIVETPRSRLPLYATAAVIIAGIAGISATFAIKRTPPAPQDIAFIKASTAPVKVAAAAVPQSDPSQGASLLDKAPQPAPTAVVSHTEQPVDVSSVLPQSGSASGAPVSGAADAPPPAAQIASTAPAASIPVPPPPGADNGSGASLADMIEPRKVKTITVRPDGSLMSAPPASPAAPSAAPAAPVGNISPPVTADTDTSDTGQAAAPPPAMAKAADLPWSDQPSTAPVPPAPEAHRARRPEHIARADSGAETGDAADASGAGGFSVQLAAPASAAEARAALNHLTRTYGAELHGYHLKFRQAKIANKTVYRVRVGGLSHAAAISLCEKLKAKGGSCFVARG
jgi:hypothetical protein